MIGPDGFFDWAVKDPGPLGRWEAFGTARTPMNTIVHHSFEGWFNPVSEDGYNVQDDPDRFPTGWHGTCVSRNIAFAGKVYPPGTLFQHYPVFARLQHANAANISGPGFELEGVSNMLITPAQIATYKRIHADMRAFTGKPYLRQGAAERNGLTGLIEHREVPGSGTACPSNRYAPLWADLALEAIKGDDQEMASEIKEAIDALVEQNRVQAELINQQQTQLWGEGQGRRTNDNPYADATMFDVEQLKAIIPALLRVVIKNGPQISGSEVLKALQEHDAQGHCLWDWVAGINDEVNKMKGQDPAA